MPTTLRNVLTPVDDADHPDLPVLSVYREYGVVLKGERVDNFNKTPQDLSSYLRVLPGDLVVNKMKAWSGSVGVSSSEGIVSGDYLVCKLASAVWPRFLHHFLRSSKIIGEMQLRSKGIRPGQERLYWDDLAAIEIDLPARDEQRLIADFLDDQAARIDNIIAARKTQIDLVMESIAYVLGEVGPSNGARSPIPWFGAWRDGWTVQRLSWLVKCHDGKRIPLNSTERSTQQGEYPYYGASAVVDHIDDYLFDGEYVLIGEDGAALENMGFDVVQRVSGKFWVNNHAHVLEATGMDVDYLAHYLRCVDRQVLISGATRPKITQEDLLSIPLVVPSAAEQRLLARLADGRRDEIHSGANLLERGITLLQELKRSLITAAVTGEFDVSVANGSAVAL